jgi:hypothetical protein
MLLTSTYEKQIAAMLASPLRLCPYRKTKVSNLCTRPIDGAQGMLDSAGDSAGKKYGAPREERRIQWARCLQA